MKVQAIFISDVHLGCKHSKVNELLSTLNQYEPENLFIIGDFIDGWILKRNPVLPQSHINVIKKILSLTSKGTKVYYITGNHDEFLRHYSNIILGNIEICDEIIWNNCYITHGDKYDPVVLNNKWLAVLGSIGYELLLKTNPIISTIRSVLGLKPISFSQIMKHRVKNAVNFINTFENIVSKEAMTKNCSHVICGHIHTPANKMINGINYLNTGDWVESMSYIIYNENKFEVKYANQ